MAATTKQGRFFRHPEQQAHAVERKGGLIKCWDLVNIVERNVYIGIGCKKILISTYNICLFARLSAKNDNVNEHITKHGIDKIRL